MSNPINPEPATPPKRTRAARGQSGRATKKASATPLRPVDDDREGWKAHWTAQRQPWRTEPEIDEERQKFLAERRGITPDIEKCIYPFKDFKLSRADVEWLLATHASGEILGPVVWDDTNQRDRQGLDLRGADLSKKDLSHLPLARLLGGLEREQWIFATVEQRDASRLHLQETNLVEAHLEEAVLAGAYLERASMFNACLQRAVLGRAHLEGALLRGSHLEGASMRATYFDAASNLADISLYSSEIGPVLINDVRWGEVDLAVVDWEHLPLLGNEVEAQQSSTPEGKRKPKSTRLEEYQRAVRAYRQLAIVLRSQGITEAADRFAYRSLIMHRKTLWWQIKNGKLGKLGSYFFSWFLAVLTGYSFRMGRIVLAYLLLIFGFSSAYYGVGINQPGDMNFWTAIIISVTAFHGRVFSNPFTPTDLRISC